MKCWGDIQVSPLWLKPAFEITTHFESYYKLNGALLIQDSCKDSLRAQKMKLSLNEWANYNEEFKYVRRSIPINNQEVTFEDYDLNKPCLILIFESITYFNDIEIFLDEVFHIYRRYLRVHKIKPGCVEVTLQFPANMELLLQVCIDKKCESVKHYAKMHIISNKNQQTESPVDATSIDLISEQIFGSCIKEETREHNFIGVQKEDGPSSTTQGRDVLWSRSQSYAGTQSPVYIRTKPRKRANTTDASSKEELCKRTKQLRI